MGEKLQFNLFLGFVNAVSNPKDRIIENQGLLLGKIQEYRTDEGGWDYGEYPIKSDDPWIPDSHGGVSGSAVWEIEMPLDCSKRKTVFLRGVLFAEGPHDNRKLIAHGEKSVKIILREHEPISL